MRLVVDLQSCETDSRDRGIGRYTLSLVEAIAKAAGDGVELVLAIDMADPRRARDVRALLHTRMVAATVVAYGYPAPSCTDSCNAARRSAAQLRSRFFASLRPDVLLICSLMETGGRYTTLLDWDVLSGVRTAVVAYDLIPLIFPDQYLAGGDALTSWYKKRVHDYRKFDRVLAISQSTKEEFVTRLQIEANRITVVGAGVDVELAQVGCSTDAVATLSRIGVHKPFILMTSNGDWRKNTVGALDAFSRLPDRIRDKYQLVLTQVGRYAREALDGAYAALREHVKVLGRVDDFTLGALYRECDVFYFPSYFEGFGLPVLEAMASGAPVVCSNAGALSEVVRSRDASFDPWEPEKGALLLERALTDDQFRRHLQSGAQEYALQFDWTRVARKALDALIVVSDRRLSGPSTVMSDAWPAANDIEIMADASVEAGWIGEEALENGLRAIARAGRRRVLVDISEIARLDARTGIQRVTRRFFEGLKALARETDAFDVEPFCWTDHGVVYARRYARMHLDTECDGPDEPVRVEPSDLVFMVDSSWWSPERFDEFHERVQRAGGEVIWMVYDLVPIRFPETCGSAMPPAFGAWLIHAAETADGFIAISEATRSDVGAFMDGILSPGAYRPWTRTVHLGSDFDPHAPIEPTKTALATRQSVEARPFFVSVGTLEPRKDYKTILDAFDVLWREGLDAGLVVVGRRGWNVDDLISRIERHSEYDRRLFWVRDATDDDIRYFLNGASALIQASIAEGYGLPLVEAASMGVGVIASDIPVFHEVAGDEARYFTVGRADALAAEIRATLRVGGNVRRGAAPVRTWREASKDLAGVLLERVVRTASSNTDPLRRAG